MKGDTEWNRREHDGMIRDLFDTNEETQRPYRLWDPQLGSFVRGCAYKHLRNAHLSALIHARWSAIGSTFELLDIGKQSNALVGSYTRTVAPT
jgi:hypothetical protein